MLQDIQKARREHAGDALAHALIVLGEIQKLRELAIV
jgi:hypothetical protein